MNRCKGINSKKKYCRRKIEDRTVIKDVSIVLMLNTNRGKIKTVTVSPLFNMKNLQKLAKNKLRIKAKVFYRLNGDILAENDVLDNKAHDLPEKGLRLMD